MSDSGSDVLVRNRLGWKGWVVVVVSLTLAAAAVSWAVVTVSAATAPSKSEPKFVTGVARAGSVEESQPLRAEARWERALAARNVIAGTVTSVSLNRTSLVSTGTEVYAVDLQPVFVAEGAVPAFRDLSKDAKGPDVRQLQAMLATEGFLWGNADGVFGDATVVAVKRWQEQHDLEPTGVVEAGRVLFVEALPAQLSVDSTVAATGMALSGGEAAVLKLAAQPTIDAPVTLDAVNSVTPGMVTVLRSGDVTWEGRVKRVVSQDDGSFVATLGTTDREGCGVSCPFQPGQGDRLQLQGSLIIVPKRAGVVVPTAAIQSSDGERFVTDASGRRRTVVIKASAEGKAVVEGIAAGTRVRILS